MKAEGTNYQVKTQDSLSSFRMTVDERMNKSLPSIWDHIKSIPPGSRFRIKIFDDFGERSKDGGTLLRTVDDVIEKVLENGGDVEFVDEGLLKQYDHIALISFY